MAIFALAFVARFLYLGLSIHANNGDLLATISGADGYYTVSHNLILGHGLSSDTQPPFTPYSFRPPLYHFFIAAAYFMFGGYWGVIIAQIIIASLLPVFGYLLASYLTDNKKILICVGTLLALEPSAILYSTFFYSETFFMFWFFLSLLFLFAYITNDRREYFFMSALLLGAATLTRPTTEFLPVGIIGLVLWQKRTFLTRKVYTDTGVYLLLFLIILAPWIYRNHLVFGTAEISPQTGVNLYTVLLPTVYAIDRGTTFQQEFSALSSQGVLGPNEAPVSVSGTYVREAIPLLLAHPKALAISVANSELNFFVQDGTFDFLRHIKVRPNEMLGRPATFAFLADPLFTLKYVARNILSPVAAIAVGRIIWIFLTAAALLGIWLRSRWYERTPQHILAIGIVLYFALTSSITGFGLTSRYRLPVNPLIITFACIAIAAIFPWLKQRIKRWYA